MGLSNLKNYIWRNGSTVSPVNLSQDEFNGLTELIKSEGITKDLQGYIHPINAITSHQDYLVRTYCPNLHLVNPTINPTDYNVELSTGVVNEGGRIKINVYLIDIEALDFRVTNHSIVSDGAITDETIQSRIHIDKESGYIVIDPAKENATWTDEVTIQCLPVYESWDSPSSVPKILSFTVIATKITGATITAADTTAPGKFFNTEVTFTPAEHTKPIVEDVAQAANGIYLDPFSEDFTFNQKNQNVLTWYAPTTQGSYQLGCNVYVFGYNNAHLLATVTKQIQVTNPYIQVIINTDGTFSEIVSANPKLSLQKLNSSKEPIGTAIELTGVQGESTFTYTYNNNVKLYGSEKYRISFPDIYKYEEIETIVVVPTQVITTINKTYVLKKPKIYFANADGSRFDKAEDAIARGRVTFTPKYMCVYEPGDDTGSNPERVMCFELNPNYLSNLKTYFYSAYVSNNNDLKSIIGSYDIRNYIPYKNFQNRDLDFDGYNNTLALKRYLDDTLNDMYGAYPNTAGTYEGNTFDIFNILDTTFMGKQSLGYIIAGGELNYFKTIYSSLKTICTSLGLTIGFKPDVPDRHPNYMFISNTDNSVNAIWQYGNGDSGSQSLYMGIDIRTLATSDLITTIYPFIHIDIDEFKARNNIGRPKLKVEITTNETDPTKQATILGQEITVTTPDSTEYELTNGQSIEVLGDGTETYEISAPQIQGYVLQYQQEVTPDGQLTVVTVNYEIFEEGVYLVYDDGSYQSYDDYVEGGYQLLPGKTLKGPAVVTDETAFVINPNMISNENYIFARNGASYVAKPEDFVNYQIYSTQADADLDLDGYKDTKDLIRDLQNPRLVGYSIPAKSAQTGMDNVTPFIINGNIKEWYFASKGEGILVKNNSTAINAILLYFNVQLPYIESLGSSTCMRIESGGLIVWFTNTGGGNVPAASNCPLVLYKL